MYFKKDGVFGIEQIWRSRSFMMDSIKDFAFDSNCIDAIGNKCNGF
jgi:hypothetical protein